MTTDLWRLRRQCMSTDEANTAANEMHELRARVARLEGALGEIAGREGLGLYGTAEIAKAALEGGT
jgi:hypothetical protein